MHEMSNGMYRSVRSSIINVVIFPLRNIHKIRNKGIKQVKTKAPSKISHLSWMGIKITAGH